MILHVRDLTKQGAPHEQAAIYRVRFGGRVTRLYHLHLYYKCPSGLFKRSVVPSPFRSPTVYFSDLLERHILSPHHRPTPLTPPQDSEIKAVWGNWMKGEFAENLQKCMPDTLRVVLPLACVYLQVQIQEILQRLSTRSMLFLAGCFPGHPRIRIFKKNNKRLSKR